MLRKVCLLSVFGLLVSFILAGPSLAQEEIVVPISVEESFLHQVLKGDTLFQGFTPKTRAIYEQAYVRPSYREGVKPSTFMVTTFAPLIFDVGKLLSLEAPMDTIQRILDLSHTPLFPFLKSDLQIDSLPPIWSDDHSFYHNQRMYYAGMALREYIFRVAPDLVEGTTASLPTDRLGYIINTPVYKGEFFIPLDETDMLKNIDLSGEKIAPKYWYFNFLAGVDISQNQVSENWHKGGRSSLNVNTRFYGRLTYSKSLLKWVNTLEYKLGFFKQPETTKRKVQIGEDVFRLQSNLGIKAKRNWYYTFDVSLNSQLLNNYSLEESLTTRPFAPIKMNAGLGVKYDIDKKNFQGNPFSRLRFSVNLAPVAAQLIYVWSSDVDKKRVGLTEDETYKLNLGSTVKANCLWDFNGVSNWESRLFYNTSYQHTEIEFENTFTYGLTRFLTAKININLRYDDSVILDEPKTAMNLLQYNELMSIGFTYKL